MEAPESGQNEDVTVPSDEGNPDTEGDDISDETPAEEDSVTEEPSEEEVVSPTIDSDQMTIMEADQIVTNALSDKKLYPSIMNDEKDKWTLTKVEGLSAEGKTYLTVAEIDNSWDGFIDADTNAEYSKDGIAGDALTGKILAFGVDLKTGYKFKSDDTSKQVTAGLMADNTTIREISASYVDAAGEVPAHYEIDLGTITESEFGENDSLDLKVWVEYEEEEAPHTVTVTKSTIGIKKVTYLFTKENTDPTDESTELTGTTITSTDSTQNLKLYVEPTTGYDVTVKKDNGVVSGNNNVYNLGCITSDITVDITAEKTGYEVKSNVVRAEGETETTITADALAAVQVKWGRMVDENGVISATTSNLTFTLDGLGDLKAAVSYKNKDNSVVPLTPNAKGTYTVPMTVIKELDGITIDVTVRNAAEPAITVDADSNVEEVTYKNAEGEFVELAGDVKGKEDEKFEFKVNAKEFFKVADVTAKTTSSNEEVEVKEETVGTGDDAATVYSFVAGAEAITITVETELDEEQCYQLDLDVDGDEGSVTVAVTKTEDGTEADTPALNATLPADKKVVTRNESVQVVLTVDGKYTLAEGDDAVAVKFGTEDGTITPVEDVDNTYTIDLQQGKLATLTVKTERAPLAAENTVTFTNSADHMKLTVTEVENKVTADESTPGKYTLAEGVKDLDFTLVADGPYKPEVKYSTTKEVKPKTTAKGEDGKTTTYTYSLAAALLGTNDTIVITETDSKKTLTVIYDEESVDVTLKQGNEDVGVENDGSVSAEVTEGETLTVIAQAKDNCALDSITEQIGDAEETAVADFKQGSLFYKYDVKADEDVTITITAAKGTKVLPLKDLDNNTELALNKNKKYDVSYNGSYEAAVMEGTAQMALAKFRITTKSGRDTVEVDEVDEDGNLNYSTEFSKGDDAVQITLAAGLAGKECTLELYADDATLVATYALVVSKLPEAIDGRSVKINKGKAITQTVDTTLSYDVAVNSGADVNELSFVVPTADAEKDIVKTAELEDGKLVITTGFGEGTVNLEVWTGSGGNKTQLKNGDNNVQVVVTTAPLLKKADKKYIPTVKQVSSTDVSMTLSLGAKNIATPNGTVYYEVELTPDKTALADADKTKLKDKVLTYVEKDGDAQEERFVVGASDVYGSGVECQYAVKVRLIHVPAGTTMPIEGSEIAAANVKGEGDPFTKAAGKDFMTKNPTYETNLKLKKGTTTVYTTQENVVVATPIFSKETSYTVLPSNGATDITSGLDSDEILDVSVDDNQIVVSSDEDTKLGKHTIQVLATTTDGDTMYASRATIVVTVVRGIEDISLDVPTNSIYYADKAVKVKTAVAYNTDRYDQNPKDSVPKAKKVTYKLVPTSVNWSSLNNLDALNNVAEAPVVKDGVTIDKNGQISIPKNYKVSADSKFKVLVRAADFADNTAYDLSDEITITRDYMQIAKAVIAQVDDEKNYKVIATADDTEVKTVEASELNGAMMIALAPGLPVKDSYTNDEIKQYQISSNVSYTSGNKKAVEFYENRIWVNAPANKIKLTAAPTDGSAADKKLNSTKTITLNVTYDLVNDLGLEVYKPENGGTPEKSGELKATGENFDYNDSSTPRFYLSLISKDDEEDWVDAPDYTDYKLTVSKGGKILPKDMHDGPNTVQIAATDKQTTIKLTYKVYNETKKKYDSVNKEYTLTNAGFKAAVDAKVKAPKVVFYNKKNTIQSNPNGDRWIGFNLQPNGKDYPLDFEAGKVIGKEGSEGDLYVKVDVDWSAMTAKNKADLETLANNMYPYNYQKLNSNGYVYLGFDDVVFTPGSYKLKVSVGTVDDDRNFVPAAQPAAITIKVAKDKALSFKPTTSYKISAKDNGYALLTGKGNYDKVVFSNLQNDNVKGKAKGKENAFRTYFNLVEDDDNEQYFLQMTDACFENGALKEISKDDLTGYVSYEAGYNYTDPSATVKGTVKITVKLEGNTISKYAVTNATASKDANAVANVTVTADKKPVQIVYALVTGADKGGTWKVVTKSGASWIESLTPYSSDLILQHTDDADKGTKAKVTLRVIPAGSYYASKIAAVDSDNSIAENDKAAAKADIITTYGVELKTTITLNDLADAKTNKRIAVDKANLTQTFTAYESYNEQKGSESGFNTPDRNYWIDVPYTELYVGAKDQIKKITSDKEWISFNKASDGSTVISIAMNKDDMQNHFNDCYQKKTVKGQTVYQPKKLKVKATVYYGGTAGAPADPKDDITFTLTMPTEPYFMNEVGEDGTITKSDYEQAVAVIEQNAEQISKSIADYMQKYGYPWLNEDSLEDEIKEEVTYQLENRIRGYLGDDSGVDLSDIQSQMTVDDGTFKAPTTTAAGLVKVTVKLTNGKDGDDKKETSVVFTVNLPAFEATVSEVKDAVEEFLDQATAYNKTTKADLLKDLKAYMAENYQDYVTTSIRYEITEFDKDPATTSKNGTLKVKINVYNIATEDEAETDEKEITIAKLLGEDDLITAVEKAVGVKDPDSGTKANVIAALTETNNRAKVKKAVLDAANDAIVGNPYKVEFEKKAESATNDTDADTDEFDFDPATGTEEGLLSFKLRIKNENGENLDADNATKGVITLTEAKVAVITGLLLPAEAKAKVEAWITANTLTAEDDASTTTKVLKNGATEASIITAIKANGVSETNKIEVSFKKDTFKITPATVNDEGKIEGTIVLKDTMENEDPEEVTLDVDIPVLPQTEAEAVIVIKAAVLDAVTAGDIVVTATATEEELAAATEAIEKAAKEAKGLKKDAFDITVTTPLAITEAVDQTPAKATITLTVKLKTATSGDGTPCPISFDIPAETPETPAE